jgi:hypothetical protein
VSEEKRIPIAIPVETNADEAADSLESLRARIASGTESLKEMAGAMRRLRGTSDEVKAAKDQLKSKIDAERAAISQSQLAIQKAGTSYEQLAEKAKKQPKLGFVGSIITSQNPVKALREKLDGLKGSATNSQNHLHMLGQVADGVASKTGSLARGGLKLATAGVLALVAACVALTAAAAATGVGFAKFIFGAANAARTAGLMREAAYGGAENAAALGTQIDALSKKIPTSKEALNELAVSLSMAGVQGQTLVDTFNAIGQASAAVGDSAANKLRELVERGRLTQRFAVNALELHGSGLNFEEFAKALSTQMGVGIAQAKKALAEGRVKLGDGAAALRKAVEDKFGGINLRRMSDLNVVAAKFKERLSALATGVNLERLSKPMADFLDMFDAEKSVSGATLKTLITMIGDGLVGAIARTAPYAKTFFKGLMIGALDLLIIFFKLRNRLQDTFGNSELLSNIDGMKLALNAGKFAAVSLALAIGIVVGAIAIVGAVAGGAALAVVKAGEVMGGAMREVIDTIKKIDLIETGRAIVDGLIDGLKSRAPALADSIGKLGETVKKTFKEKLQIFSPSRLFRQYGRNTAEGYVEGVDDGAEDASEAVSRMVAPKGASSGASAGGGAKNITFAPQLTVSVNGGGGDAEAIAKAVGDGVRREMTALFDELLVELGVPRVSPSFPEAPAT